MLMMIMIMTIMTMTNGYRHSWNRVSTKTSRILSSSADEYGFSDVIVSALLNSPLYNPIVNTAKNTMVKAAQTAGVDWMGNLTYLSQTASINWDNNVENIIKEKPGLITPDYYKKRFHGYEDGNLEIKAAIEQELAGRAVGARNFPNDGYKGEDRLRKCYDDSILEIAGSIVPNNCTIVDFGCGTGTSTRRLAKLFPQANKVIGFDLSPHMLAVGRYLMNNNNNFNWVEKIDKDDRITLQYEDIANTKLPDESVSFVSICFVLHELPNDATVSILTEAHRILEPGGTLSILEMDPSTPGFKALRSSPFVFSILSSTEPYLKDYFRLAPNLNNILNSIGFPVQRMNQATGRHFNVVAHKGGIKDFRSFKTTIDEHVSSSIKNYQT